VTVVVVVVVLLLLLGGRWCCNKPCVRVVAQCPFGTAVDGKSHLGVSLFMSIYALHAKAISKAPVAIHYEGNMLWKRLPTQQECYQTSNALKNSHD
jgi:hypothetical protein